MSIASNIQRLISLTKELASTLRSKGVEATDGEGFETLVPKVEQIGGGGGDDWLHFFCASELSTAKNNQYIFPAFITGEISAEWEDTLTSVQSYRFFNSHFKKFSSTRVTSVIANAFRTTSCTEIYIPNCISVGTTNCFRNNKYLEKLTLGTLQVFGSVTTFTDSSALTSIIVGENTDIDLVFSTWVVKDNISTEEQQLALVSNVINGILNRVEDHSGEGIVREIPIGWVKTLHKSSYQSVVSAVDQLIANFANKGWNLKEV